jgi:hypothetical protein
MSPTLCATVILLAMKAGEVRFIAMLATIAVGAALVGLALFVQRRTREKRKNNRLDP